MTALDGTWRELAAELGVVTEYWDVHGELRQPPAAAVEAVAVAMLEASGLELAPPQVCVGRVRRDRADRIVPPVVVAWNGDGLALPLWARDGVGGRARIELIVERTGERLSVDVVLDELPEGGGCDADGASFHQRWLRWEGALPLGRHRVDVELADGSRGRAAVLAAPRRAFARDPGERAWGAFAPLHAVREQRLEGPDLETLDALARWVGDHGGQVVGTLPMLASFAGGQHDPSPYASVSRRYWNELFLDLGGLPGVAAATAAGEVLATDRSRALLSRLSSGEAFDHAARAQLVTSVLHAASRAFHTSDDPSPLRAFVEAHPDVVRYARFRAAVDALGAPWPSWPAGPRDGDLDAIDDLDDEVVDRHVYAQWALDVQLHEMAARFEQRGQRLYLDLPVGCHAHGYDTWAHRDLFALGMAAGAPPDEFFEQGQNWGFPPVHPEMSRRDGHAFFGACVAAHAALAGMLRLDHVMQLERLFWVPSGMPAADGVYVRYPREELFAVLTLESHRSGCTLVGEDLGTVPDEIRHAMREHGVAGMYVLQFEVPEHGQPTEPRADQVASIGTHDTATFAGFAGAHDVERNVALGLVAPHEAEARREHRAGRVECLRELLRQRGLVDDGADDAALLRGALRWLAASDAGTVLVSVDDLWGEIEPQNVPGTPASRPNWVLRWATTLDELAADAALAADLEVLRHARQAAVAARAERQGGGP